VKDNNLSAILLVLTSCFGVSATLDKAWRKPFEEAFSMWSIQVCSVFLSIVAIESFSYATLVKTGANLFVNIAIATVILVSRHKNKA